MTSVKLILEKSCPLKNGSYSVVFQIIQRRMRRLIYTGFRVYTEEFDELKERVKFLDDEIKSKNKIRMINRRINKQRKSINAHIMELERRGVAFNVADITSSYHIEHDSLSLLGYFDLIIGRKQDVERLGIMKSYKSTRSSVAKFVNSRHIRISDVNFAFIRDYEQFLVKSSISPNSICFYMRNFKSIYNQAIIDGYKLPEKIPFKYVQAKTQKTTKRALGRDDLIRIRDMNLEGKKKLILARDLFFFSFYTRGMAMVDILNLTNENIRNRIISYRRQKTSQYIEIAVTDELAQIMDVYRNDSNYIFPILKGTDAHEIQKSCQYSLNRTNRHLKKIGHKLNLEIELTTYVARHSWATQAKKIGVTTAIISEGLGHTSEKTTQIYLKAFEQNIIDVVNEEITRLM